MMADKQKLRGVENDLVVIPISLLMPLNSINILVNAVFPPPYYLQKMPNKQR